MAPELALSTKVEPSIDIYALGCVGYFLTTGELVFEGKTAMDVALKHVKEEPAPPSERTELSIPEALESLILKCIRKDPAKRPTSAAALRARLEELAKAHPWTTDDSERWWRTNLPEVLDTPESSLSIQP